MNVSGLTRRLFEPLVPEPSSVVAVGVGDEDARAMREPARSGRVDDECRVRGADDETVEPADSIVSYWSSSPEWFLASESRRDEETFPPLVPYLQSAGSD